MLMTKPKGDDMYSKLQVCYRDIYVPLVSGNIFERPRTFAGNFATEEDDQSIVGIYDALFAEKIKEYFSKF